MKGKGLMEMDTLLTEEDLKSTLEQLADSVLAEHPSLEDIMFVGVITNGFPLAERLAGILYNKTDIKVPIGKLDVSIYRDDIESLGQQYVTIRESHLPQDIHNKTVILVDDVLHHGRTIRAALEALLDFGRPKKVELLVLVDRGQRELPIMPNYAGLKVDAECDDYVSVSLYEVEAIDKVCIGTANT